MAGLTFDINMDGIDAIALTLAQAAPKSEHVIAIQVQKDTQPYMPALNQSMINRTRVDGNTIIYPGPYSRFLYYGKLMVDPDTGSAWAKKESSKVVTDKYLVFNKSVNPQAQSHWFEASKAQNLGKWIRVAGKEIADGTAR